MMSDKTGLFISQLRKEKNLTQKQLAKELNVSDKAVSRWETGRGYPDVNSLLNLSDFFDVSVNELLAGKYIEKQCITEIAEENIINAVASKESAVKRKTAQMVICVILLCIVLLPPAIPAFIYFADTIMLCISFENAFEFIGLLCASVLLLVVGFVISKGHISLLHSYHYKNVVNRKAYCKAMGRTIMLMSVPMLLCAITCLFPSVKFVVAAGELIMLSGSIVGCVCLFKYQYKYNGGIF